MHRPGKGCVIAKDVHQRARADCACDQRFGLEDDAQAIQSGGEQHPAIIHLETRMYLNAPCQSVALERPFQIRET